MAPADGRRMIFSPKVDAAVRSSKPRLPLPAYPKTVWPIFDPDNEATPCEAWTPEAEQSYYPAETRSCGTAACPEIPLSYTARYLRAFLAENERLRVSMLWYYTRDIRKETEFLLGLQEKALLAQESTGWEYVVIGILDLNFYIRLATIGLPIAVLPRGETLCAHTITRPPGSVFLLPNMMDDWRFRSCPYVESGGLRAYAGAPLRLQNESGDCVALGSICVCSGTAQEPLTKQQQNTLVSIADWVVSDIIHCARARRQRDRRRMGELITSAQKEADLALSEVPVFEILKDIYPGANIGLQSLRSGHVEIEGREPVEMDELEGGLWEDVDRIDEFIRDTNHKEFPTDRVVRITTAECESISGHSLLVVASKDFRLIFDDVDSWFVQTCASMISQVWQKRLLSEAMKAKERFLRGFSHQLRTPLHGILSSAELLAEELTRSDSRDAAVSVTELLEAASTASAVRPSTYLDIIKTAGRDLIAIINNMITLNRWADIAAADRDLATHSIYELEAEIANELRLLTSRNLPPQASVIFSYDILAGSSDLLRTDLGLVRDSLLPLIINALQNTEQGSIVVTVSLRPVSRELIVDVEDTGCGVHPDDHGRIFEPYEKVDPHSMGVGLGLTLSSKFASLLQGSVALVSSEPGRGSHFRATFEDVDYIVSSTPSPQISTTLTNLPRTFHHLPSKGDSASLCEHFAKHLAQHGYAASDSKDNCFLIFDYALEDSERQTLVAQVPTEQVAICLVPASIGDEPVEKVSNVIFVPGPFYHSTMASALQSADELVLSLFEKQVQAALQDQVLPVTPTLDGPHASQDLKPEDETITAKPEPPIPVVTADAEPETNVEVTAISTTSPIAQLATILKSPDVAKPTALLVDDNAINLRILQVYCKKRGLPYHCAVDGSQAVDIFARHQAQGSSLPIQLILMDLQMPVCDGIEATRRIRGLEAEKGWARSAVFIVTGQDGPKDRVAASEAGADDYFVKPVGIKLLDESVRMRFPAFVGV